MALHNLVVDCSLVAENKGKPIEEQVETTFAIPLTPLQEQVQQSKWDEIDAQRANDQKVNGYKALRELEYPKISDQLDMLWHAMDSGLLTMVPDFYKAIKAVKDKYPKDVGNG